MSKSKLLQIYKNKKKYFLTNGKNFSEEIINDQIKSAMYINRARDAIANLGEENHLALQEKNTIDLYKRSLLLIGSGDLEITDNNGNTVKASANNLPISSYLSHGSRVMIEIPCGSKDLLINWLSSGNILKNNLSLQRTQLNAINENKLVYTRLISTHKVNFKQIDNEVVLTEKKGFFISLKGFVTNFITQKSNHFGLDLALDAPFGEKNSKGKIVDYPDGEHGHLYIYYKSSTSNKPGAMLIGIENANPSSAQHSKLGKPNKLSPIGGVKFDKLEYKKQIETDCLYKDTIIPKIVGGMKITLDQKKLEEIVNIEESKYGIELAFAKPASSFFLLDKALEELSLNFRVNDSCNADQQEIQISGECLE